VAVIRAAPTRPRRAPLRVLFAAVVLAAAIGPAAAVARSNSPGVVVRLSDLHTISRWAYPSEEAVVRASPSSGAQALGRLRFLTADAQAELYLALSSIRLASRQTWVQVELPARPDGQFGWVPRGALGAFHVVDGYLLVDQRSLRATLFRHGHAIFSAPIGVGKASTVTPSGQFYVMEKLTALKAPMYGPYALGTSAYAPTLTEWPGGGVVGIHGTNEPRLIPGRPSHGCIRLRNADITRLWSVIAVGTPIEIT
jgi:hypothetical protein